MISTKDGLPQSFVSGILQDRDGFVWIGTRNGLARYDGRHFKVFQHNISDTSTLHSNVITYMKMDAHNRIWIKYDEHGSIDCFDPVTERVEHITERRLFRSDPTNFPSEAWLPASDGSLWCLLVNKGMIRYDWKQNLVSRFSVKTGRLPSDTVATILEDRDKRIWIMTCLGLSRYDPITNRFRHFPFPFRHTGTNFSNIIQCQNGELMFGDRQRLFFFNPATAMFRTLAFKQHFDYSLSLQTGADSCYYFMSGHVIYRYDGDRSIVPVINMNDFSLPGLLSWLIDRSGLVWLGLNAEGIWQIDLHAPAFSVHPTVRTFPYDILKQEFGFTLDSFSRNPSIYGFFNGSGYDFRSVYDVHHRLFIAISNRVGFFDPQQQKWSELPRLPEPPKKLANRSPEDKQSICFDPENRLWAVNDNHFIGYFDTSRRQWVTFLDSAAVKPIEDMDILLDVNADAHKLWITSNEGLLSIDRATKKIGRFNKNTTPNMLPTGNLLGLQADPSRPDLLWIGSYEGLICLHKSKLRTEVFTTAQGLPDNTIYSIQTDGQGYLWLSTNQGLCRFHPITHEVRNFKTEDGLPGNEFNRFHHLKLPDGRLAFGGTAGWVVFDPATITPDTYQPQVAFTGLKIYNEPVSYSPSSRLLPRPLNDITELVLPYDQNTLTFDFAGLQYNQPGELRYRYRMERYDDKWIETENPVASYTKLLPGHYTLLVNCTNTLGRWSGHVRRLKVLVQPPWWRTWWAYLCYVLVLAGAVYALYRNWLQQAKAKQLIQLQQKEAEQLKAVDEMKNRFFSNITHEFRTPLSLILAPLEQLQQSDTPPPGWKTSLGKIQGSAAQLLRLINQLLDMSKLEAGSMKTTLFRGNPQKFVQDVAESFEAAATPKNILLRFQADKPVIAEYLFDADKVQTILSNLLSNAIKFTPRGGHVTVTLAHETQGAAATVFSFHVQDSGIGIAPDKLPFIFNRFYQADDSSTRSYGGTGIGLALAKEMAELMGGSLHAESEPGQGSTFILRLSLAPAAGADVPAYIPVKPPVPELPAATTDGAEIIADNGNRPLVLIAEDNPELNEFLAQAFRHSYRVLTAIDGTEGWRLAQQELPDVIVSDWMMPGMDGHAFCQAVKGDLLTGHIAFIMLTARAAPASRLQALQSQADDYLTKPFSTEELQLRVANLLKRQQRLREKLFQELSGPGSAGSQIHDKEEATTEDPFISKIHSVIEEKLDEPAFGVEELAAGLYMSRANLHRKVKAVADLTPTLLIRNYRLKRAAQFLHEGSISSEAAYKAGFDSAAYFSKCFREFYHCTPSEFTRNA